MQGYNNLSGNNGMYGGGWSRPNGNTMGPSSPWVPNDPRAGYGYGNSGYNGGMQYPNQQKPMDDRIFVTGRAGADAHQLPPGVNAQILWDNDEDRFYIKGYDNNGRPRVLADYDFQPHVDPEPVHQTVDMSAYPTKDDIAKMISDAFNNITYPNLSTYVTQEDLNNALSNLAVGNGGRIVRSNESNA